MPSPDREKRLSALEKVLQISRDMVATSDLDELLGVIIARSMELLEAERATLFLYDADSDELFSKIAAEAGEIRFPAGVGIAGAVVRSKQVLNVPDAYADERFNRNIDRQTGFRTRNILAVPLLDYAGELVGVLEVLNKRRSGFDNDDITLAETLGAQAGVVIQRARLLEHYLEKQRMEQALRIARQIQQDILPKENPRIAGFDMAGWSSPADETGGDIYDFLELGDGRWTFMLADATGHGIGPALVIAEARAMLRALSGADLDIPAVMARVNDLLTVDLGQSRFVTCLFALLDGPVGIVRYVSAGQGPIIFYDRAADKFDELPATSLPLGILEGTEYNEQVNRRLAAGDMMILTTDGFFEAADAEGELFGTERMCQIIRRCRDLSADEIIQNLRQKLFEFTGPVPQADDLTAIIVKKRD
ncbi:MAG: GAF domain-containing SpoIIE family protein phosphatase [Planctomycetota bacterium]|nr:GAF domain-containing SpoIIE family protein phosphatase [Planctomycetota bacterium]